MDRKLTNIKERILYLTDYYNISKEDFFSEIGVSYSAFRGKNKESDLKSGYIDSILTFWPKVNARWLISGNPPIFNSNPEKLVDKNLVGIPLLPIDAIAGLGGGEVQVMDYEGKRYVVPEFNELGVEFVIMVKGDSMLPKYKSGDLLGCKMLKTDTFFQWNQVYVLTTDQGPVIKRIAKSNKEDSIICVSENKDYAPFELHRDQWYDIAIVMGVIRLE